ncbi:MAG: GntR family transcriptional regulator [Humibacillus sp.]|nr:GntR family transcriptional regulator [Humibacillus sp.]
MLRMPSLTLPREASSLADAVVEAVRVGVTSGELVPERTYSVYQLAELLDVSRSPVRDALLRLSEAGLVRIERNRGFRVLTPQPHDIAEIIDIRLALEPPAARRAAERADEDQHAAIRSAFDALAAATGDEARFWPADQALHDHLMRAAGNERAAAIVERLRATTALLGPPTTTTGRTLAEICDEHAPIVEAVLARRGDAAERAMREHLEHTGALLTRALEAQGPNDPSHAPRGRSRPRPTEAP